MAAFTAKARIILNCHDPAFDFFLQFGTVLILYTGKFGKQVDLLYGVGEWYKNSAPINQC